MKLLFATLLMALVPHQAAGRNEPFACNMAALTRTERATHHKLSQRLLGAVEERRELQSGYAFRLPAKTLLAAAQWVSLEGRCCPFFAFELERRDEHPARLGEKALGVLGALPFAEYRREQQRRQGAHAAEQLRLEQVLVA